MIRARSPPSMRSAKCKLGAFAERCAVCNAPHRCHRAFNLRGGKESIRSRIRLSARRHSDPIRQLTTVIKAKSFTSRSAVYNLASSARQPDFHELVKHLDLPAQGVQVELFDGGCQFADRHWSRACSRSGRHSKVGRPPRHEYTQAFAFALPIGSDISTEANLFRKNAVSPSYRHSRPVAARRRAPGKLS